MSRSRGAISGNSRVKTLTGVLAFAGGAEEAK
jgi:hypothetical protein